MAQASSERPIEEPFGNPNMQLDGLVARWPEDRDYQALETVESVSRVGPRVTLHCRTERGEPARLLVDVCTAAVFRLQLVGERAEPDRLPRWGSISARRPATSGRALGPEKPSEQGKML